MKRLVLFSRYMQFYLQKEIVEYMGFREVSQEGGFGFSVELGVLNVKCLGDIDVWVWLLV